MEIIIVLDIKKTTQFQTCFTIYIL